MNEASAADMDPEWIIGGGSSRPAGCWVAQPSAPTARGAARRAGELALSAGIGRLGVLRMVVNSGSGARLWEFREGELHDRGALRRLPFDPRPWSDGPLGAALEEFHALAPLAEVRLWRGEDGAGASVFRLQRPVPLTQILGSTILSPFGAAAAALAGGRLRRVVSIGFVGKGIELAFRSGAPWPDLPPGPVRRG